MKGSRLAVLGVAACVAVGAAPAGATVYEKGHYSDTFSFSYDNCGFEVEVAEEFSGVFRIREGKGKDDGAFFAHDNYAYRQVHTNPDTGEFFVVTGDANFNETRATRVAGNVFEFDSVDAGQPFTVTDSDGNVILRDRGVVRETIQFDTKGDDVPGGTFVKEVSFASGGPHPGLDFGCEQIAALIGP